MSFSMKREFEKIFYEIIEKKQIKPVYQPIVLLRNGEIFGYEALGRIDRENCPFGIGEMFEIANELHCVWETEDICRKKGLKAAAGRLKGKKLFLNVDPNIMYDKDFQSGTTAKYLKKYGLCPGDIIFEVTERSCIKQPDLFFRAVEHYRCQKYKIAVDDFGSGYSGLNRICTLNPDYIKIDMEIVKDIDRDAVKKCIVKNLVYLANDMNMHLIAEGIETEEELKTVISLGVEYGQGFFIKRPSEGFEDVDKKIKKKITELAQPGKTAHLERSLLGTVGSICRRRDVTSINVPAVAVYEFFKTSPGVREICVEDENEMVIGLITQRKIFAELGGQYGYTLAHKKNAGCLMETNYLAVDCDTAVETVSKAALSRDSEHLYDAVVVTKDGRYYGTVTVKDLLETAINIQVRRAADTNPLTGLPGNSVIGEKISECINSSDPFSVIYIDIDNFKAYNDLYGFNSGDLMIKAAAMSVALSCTDDFYGHIGGDDFIIISRRWEVEGMIKSLFSEFCTRTEVLYNEQDRKNGFIISKNRHGETEKFPLATLSVAVVTNKLMSFNDAGELSKQAATAKKMCKQEEGNSFVMV